MSGFAPGALDGIRILDFTQMMLGPYGTQLLADLGADVVKIERLGGEWERTLSMMGELVAGDSAAFLAMNRNKRSVSVDLKASEVRQALLELGRSCDVVVENFRPGVLSKLGLGYEDFKELRSDIIYCSGSGWGQYGTFAREGRPGQDLLIQAMSGLAAAGGRANDPPMPSGTSIVDASTALTLANGVLAALLARERQGIGQYIEVDLFSTAMSLQCQEISAMVNQGREWERSARGVGQAWLSAPFGIYRASDGWLALAMAPVDVVGSVLGVDAVDALDPWQDRDRIKDLLEDATSTRPVDEVVAALSSRGVWCARVRTAAEAVAEMREQEHDMLTDVEHSNAGRLELLGCPIRMSETPWQFRHAPPAVGEHTDQVLGEVLPEERLTALRTEGAIS